MAIPSGDAKRPTVLVTGASGFIAQRLLPALVPAYEVVALSRRPVATNGISSVEGDFASERDLLALEGRAVDVVIHLAAEGSRCSERAGLDVNVTATAALLGHFVERGCRRFVVTGSIAAVGSMEPSFVPLEIPVSADHPCLARDPYGLTKALMEHLVAYFCRRHSDISATVLRLGAVRDDVKFAADRESRLMGEVVPGVRLCQLPFVFLARVDIGDVVDAIVAATAASSPGFRRANVVGPTASCDEPVALEIRRALGHSAAGDPLDALLANVEPGAPIYSLAELEERLGVRPVRPVRPSQRIRAARA